LSSEDSSKSGNQKVSSQKEEELISLRKTIRLAQSKRKLCIIDDCQIRGLPEKVSCGVDDALSVIGIYKPNADIVGITSSLQLLPDNLTKQDLIIVCGGIKDISKNESIKRIPLFKSFCTKDCQH
jgi:hypothetical protein